MSSVCHRQTDDMQSQYRAMHLSPSVSEVTHKVEFAFMFPNVMIYDTYSTFDLVSFGEKWLFMTNIGALFVMSTK